MSHFNISLFSTKHTSAVMAYIFLNVCGLVVFFFTICIFSAATEEGGEVARYLCG